MLSGSNTRSPETFFRRLPIFGPSSGACRVMAECIHTYIGPSDAGKCKNVAFPNPHASNAVRQLTFQTSGVDLSVPLRSAQTHAERQTIVTFGTAESRSLQCLGICVSVDPICLQSQAGIWGSDPEAIPKADSLAPARTHTHTRAKVVETNTWGWLACQRHVRSSLRSSNRTTPKRGDQIYTYTDTYAYTYTYHIT